VVVQLLRVFQWKSFSGSSVVESVSVEEFQW